MRLPRELEKQTRSVALPGWKVVNEMANGIQPGNGFPRMTGINTNTYVSITMLFALVGGFGAVLTTLYGAKAEITTKQERFEMKLEILSARVEKFEAMRETWAFQDQYRWYVHLQRDNPNLKVPEPTDGK
jgi:hypothetical protein